MTANSFTPKLLIDKSRLGEIYELRVDCWENSNGKQFVNRFYFPNGWFDEYDERAYHWIIENDKNEIIASARVCILEEIPEDFTNLALPKNRPFAYFSRLVINPKYRRLGITYELDKVRLDFIRQRVVHFVLTAVNLERIETLKKYGFQYVGIITHFYGSNLIPDKSIVLVLDNSIL